MTTMTAEQDVLGIIANLLQVLGTLTALVGGAYALWRRIRRRREQRKQTSPYLPRPEDHVLREALRRYRLVIIHGLPKTGKTALLRHAEHSSAWRRITIEIQRSDILPSGALTLAELLRAIGARYPAIATEIESLTLSTASKADILLRELRSTDRGAWCLLTLDNFNAVASGVSIPRYTPDVEAFIIQLLDTVPMVRIILSGEIVPTLVDRMRIPWTAIPLTPQVPTDAAAILAVWMSPTRPIPVWLIAEIATRADYDAWALRAFAILARRKSPEQLLAALPSFTTAPTGWAARLMEAVPAFYRHTVAVIAVAGPLTYEIVSGSRLLALSARRLAMRGVLDERGAAGVGTRLYDVNAALRQYMRNNMAPTEEQRIHISVAKLYAKAARRAISSTVAILDLVAAAVQHFIEGGDDKHANALETRYLDLQRKQGDYNRSLELLQKIAQRTSRGDRLAIALYNLSNILVETGAYLEAREVLRHAEVLLQPFDVPPELHSQLHLNLGNACAGAGLYDEASDALTGALALSKRILDITIRTTLSVRTLVYLAEAQDATGASDAAEESIDLALKMLDASPQPKLSSIVLATRGRMRFASGSLAAAEEDLRNALRTAAFPTTRATIMHSLAETLVQQGDRAAAEQVVREAYMIATKMNDPKTIFECATLLAELYVRSNQQKHAHAILAKASAYARTPQQMALLHLLSAIVHLRRGDIAQSMRSAEMAAKTARQESSVTAQCITATASLLRGAEYGTQPISTPHVTADLVQFRRLAGLISTIAPRRERGPS